MSHLFYTSKARTYLNIPSLKIEQHNNLYKLLSARKFVPLDERLKQERQKERLPSNITMAAAIDTEKYRTFLLHECQYNMQVDERGMPKTGAIGGLFTYSYTPTSIGTMLHVLCACGRSDDITDMSEF